MQRGRFPGVVRESAANKRRSLGRIDGRTFRVLERVADAQRRHVQDHPIPKGGFRVQTVAEVRLALHTTVKQPFSRAAVTVHRTIRTIVSNICDDLD